MSGYFRQVSTPSYVETILPLTIILSTGTKTVNGQQKNVNYLSLYPGQVGGIWPKVDGKFLWKMPKDENTGNFLPYPRMEINLPEIQDKILFVWLKCRVIKGTILHAECETGEEMPPDTMEYAYLMLGYINSNGGIYQQRYGPVNYMLMFSLSGEASPSYPFSHYFP